MRFFSTIFLALVGLLGYALAQEYSTFLRKTLGWQPLADFHTSAIPPSEIPFLYSSPYEVARSFVGALLDEAQR
jgi:hypothetical protein